MGNRTNKFKLWLVKRLINGKGFEVNNNYKGPNRKNIPEKIESATKTSSGSSTRELIAGVVKRLGFRFGDVSNTKEYNEPEFDLTMIMEGCNIDGYLRQGVDKFVDQIFKEGFDFYGKDENIVSYVVQRLQYMAEATDVPLDQFLTEITEDVVKYSNSITVKSRSNDPNAFPAGMTLTGINGKDPIAGYFSLNPTTMKVQRDKNGTVTGWQQETDESGETVNFNAEDVVHIYYKRERGNAFGTPFLLPVINDVRSLRETEDNVLKMLYKNIYPFLHAKVGTDDKPGSTAEVESAQEALEDMEIDGGLVTSNIVNIDAVDTNKVIDAEPYLRYMEDRVFSGMGIPAIMFGRGETANRNTGDNMTGEMADRVKAFQKVIETNINFKIIKELLYEGGYDPVVNPDHVVEFKFHDSDIESRIKNETHAIYKFEHNAITEPEMRALLGMDPITDRSQLNRVLALTDDPNSTQASSNSSSSSSGEGNKETNNKQKPTNQYGTKTSPKKNTNSDSSNFFKVESFKDEIVKSMYKNESLKNSIKNYDMYLVENSKLSKYEVDTKMLNLISMINDIREEITDKSLAEDIIDVYIDNSFSNIILLDEEEK